MANLTEKTVAATVSLILEFQNDPGYTVIDEFYAAKAKLASHKEEPELGLLSADAQEEKTEVLLAACYCIFTQKEKFNKTEQVLARLALQNIIELTPAEIEQLFQKFADAAPVPQTEEEKEEDEDEAEDGIDEEEENSAD